MPAAYYYLVVYRKFQHNVALQIKGGWVSVVASSVNGSSATWKGERESALGKCHVMCWVDHH